MAILVDEARWPWRGTRWCHLVSDDNLTELHAFAASLGMRRVGFQGDHYDIDIEMRSIAIENGATPVEGRELIRRLRTAGLRLRPSSTYTKWSLQARSDTAADVSAITEDPVLSSFLEHGDGWFALARTGLTGQPSTGLVIFGTPASDRPALPEEDHGVGLFSRVDHEGNWSVERITPPPHDQE